MTYRTYPLTLRCTDCGFTWEARILLGVPAHRVTRPCPRCSAQGKRAPS
jgi:uncharacterized Zn finger protein